MRTSFRFGGYELEFDHEATAAAYARMLVPGPESCGCGDCRSWITHREKTLTPGVREFLSQFGIPANGEIEISEVSFQDPPQAWIGWYFIVGRLLRGNPRETAGLTEQFLIDDWQFSFATDSSFAVPAFDGCELVELHFWKVLN